MTLDEYLNGLRVLWCIDAVDFLACINEDDRDYFGDDYLWNKFRQSPHRTFVELPTHDQKRIFAIIEERSKPQMAE